MSEVRIVAIGQDASVRDGGWKQISRPIQRGEHRGDQVASSRTRTREEVNFPDLGRMLWRICIAIVANTLWVALFVGPSTNRMAGESVNECNTASVKLVSR